MYVEIEDSIYNGFDDDLKTKLKVYEPEDTTGLKNKANELLGQLKQAQADIADREAKIKQLGLKGKKSESDDLQAQLEDAVTKLNEERQRNDELVAKNSRAIVNSEASKLAATLTKDQAKLSLLAEKLGNRLKYESDTLTVLTSEGKPTVSKPQDLLSEMKEAYPFLVDGRQSSGGDAKGNNGGAGNTKEIARSEFDSMSNADRASFIKSGGRPVD